MKGSSVDFPIRHSAATALQRRAINRIKWTQQVNSELANLADELSRRGWLVKPAVRQRTLPTIVSSRYSWLPSEVVSLICKHESIASPSNKAWLITCSELFNESGSEFAWNQWEINSLTAAEGDVVWQQSIRAFWDSHFPILMSVKSGYAYVGIRSDLRIVVGEEPEFEETELLAETFGAFLKQLVDGDARLNRLV